MIEQSVNKAKLALGLAADIIIMCGDQDKSEEMMTSTVGVKINL